MKIKTKLNVVAISVGLAMLMMWLLLRYAMGSIETLKSAEATVHQLEADMLMLRRNEKDFLARKAIKYQDKFNHNFSTMQEDISQLRSYLTTAGIHTTEVDTTAAVLEQYKAKFNEIIGIHKEVGLTHKDGLQGKLRDAVHQIESQIKLVSSGSLAEQMLMLRRREKDFLLRLDIKYLGKFDKDFARFMKQLESTTLADNTKQELRTLMNS